MIRKSLAYFLMLFLLINCQGGSSNSPEEFSEDNLDQLAEIYVRSNIFQDMKVMEEYQLKGKAGLRYTEAITRLSRDPVRWQNFLKKTQEYRLKNESRFTKPASSATDLGT